MTRALIIGESLVDVVVDGDGRELRRHPGGSPANVAVALGRLGHEVRLLTWLADDEDGRLVTGHVEGAGVTLVPSSRDADRTSIARARPDPVHGESYEFDLEWRLGTNDLAVATGPLGVDVVHTGSLAAVTPPGASTVELMLERLFGQATITYDPNARPAIMGEADLTMARVRSYLETADVVKVSEVDLAWLEPEQDPLEIADSWLSLGPAVVVVTRGAGGADGLCRAGHVHVDAARVEAVDTVGAGDAFTAGLVDGLGAENLLGGIRRERLRRLDTAMLERALARATLVAGATVGRPGADPPWRDELSAGAA